MKGGFYDSRSYHTWRCVLLLRVCTTQICQKQKERLQRKLRQAETAAVVKKAVILNKGGGSAPVKAKRKVLKKPKIGEKVIQIEGMHCDHCKQSVTSELNKIDGVAAKVKLKKNGVDPVSGSTPFF